MGALEELFPEIISERNLHAVRSLLKTYISDDNLLQIAKERNHTRSKEDGARLVSYFGQALTTVPGNKGSRERATIFFFFCSFFC